MSEFRVERDRGEYRGSYEGPLGPAQFAWRYDFGGVGAEPGSAYIVEGPHIPVTEVTMPSYYPAGLGDGWQWQLPAEEVTLQQDQNLWHMLSRSARGISIYGTERSYTFRLRRYSKVALERGDGSRAAIWRPRLKPLKGRMDERVDAFEVALLLLCIAAEFRRTVSLGLLDALTS